MKITENWLLEWKIGVSMESDWESALYCWGSSHTTERKTLKWAWQEKREPLIETPSKMKIESTFYCVSKQKPKAKSIYNVIYKDTQDQLARQGTYLLLR